MPQVKHVVLLRFKSAAEDEQIRHVFNELAGLKQKIPGLLDFTSGANTSLEGLSKDFTHGFVMTFADEASRDGYLPHPAHEAVKGKIVELLDRGLDGVMVMDWNE